MKQPRKIAVQNPQAPSYVRAKFQCSTTSWTDRHKTVKQLCWFSLFRSLKTLNLSNKTNQNSNAFIIGFNPRLCLRDVANNPQQLLFITHSSQNFAYSFFQSDMDLTEYLQRLFFKTQWGKLKIETFIPHRLNSNVATSSLSWYSIGSIQTNSWFLIVKPVYSNPINETYLTKGRFL